jgi:hypothetical protein
VFQIRLARKVSTAKEDRPARSGEDKAKASDAGVKPLSGLIPFDALVPLRLRANRLPVTNRTSPVTSIRRRETGLIDSLNGFRYRILFRIQ